MQLYCFGSSRTFGTVGDETPLCDKWGYPLFVGDVVLLTHKKTKRSHLRFVARDATTLQYYIMGNYYDNNEFEYELKISHNELNEWFRLGDIRYANEERIR